MLYSNPSNLAIVACPGGEAFADEVIAHLDHIHARRNKQKTALLAKRYELDEETVIRKMNLCADILSPGLPQNYNLRQLRHPHFKADVRFTCFMNGEFKAEVNQCIRGKDVYIIQDVENHQELALNEGKNLFRLSVNDHLICLLVAIDAIRKAGAARITLMLPVYPYSRQHKKKGREGLTASFLGHLYENMGVSRVITLDIHSREIENTFNAVHMENLHGSFQIIRELLKIIDCVKEDIVVVSPDTGAVDRNKFYASTLKKPLAMLYKERDYSVVSQSGADSNITAIKLLGNVSGKTVFMADDMLGTGGTLLKAMEFLKEQGAAKVIAAISLPLFTGNAVDLFDDAYKRGLFYRIIGTNAVSNKVLTQKEWYIKTDISGLFAQVITRLHQNQSLSYLLDNRTVIEKLFNKMNDGDKNKRSENASQDV